MNKTKTKKLTIKDFMAKKLAKEEKKNKIVEIPIFDGEVIECKLPSQKEIFDATEDLGENSKTEDVVETYIPLIYKYCPMFKNKELEEACKEELGNLPKQYIVSKVFEYMEIIKIGDEICKATGADPKKLQEEVKN